jgi:hypothetical protein
LLFNICKAGGTIFVGVLQMSDSSVTSRTNMRWSPTPYPNGITHKVAGYPQSINWFAASEESCPRLCPSVLKDSFAQSQTRCFPSLLLGSCPLNTWANSTQLSEWRLDSTGKKSMI